MRAPAEATKSKRNPAGTKDRILRASMAEFSQKGFGGARTAAIAKRAKCNIRMLYHYYGGKDGLYLACLEQVYTHIRAEEQMLSLHELEPDEALLRLVEFTFDHMRNNPHFVRLVGEENTQRGRYIRKLPLVARAASALIETIQEILDRGAKAKVLRKGLDPFQLYISILSLSYLHLSNRYTLAVTYGHDLADPNWLEERRKHVCDVILAYARLPD